VNILFIDDTEQVSQQYIGIGGVIFHDSCLSDLFKQFNEKKALHGIPSEEEIKWSPDRNSWIKNNLIDKARISAYSDILALIKSFNGKIIVAVVQRNDLSWTPLEAKWQCTEFVTERFQFYLQDHDDKQGLIIADFPGSGKEEKKLLQDYYRLLKEGTRYVKPSNIVMNLLTTESHLNPALQIADLVVGITTGMCSPRRDYASAYWDMVSHNLHRSQVGEVMGCGLKVFPKENYDELVLSLFPEDIEEREEFEESYEEYVERMRELYRVLMSEDELNMHFPRP